MRIERPKLSFFRDLYSHAKSRTESMREKMEEWKSYLDGTRKQAGGENYKATRNICYELIESQVSTVIPKARVAAERWSEKNERNAIRTEHYLNVLRDKHPFEMLNDRDERSAYAYGGTVWMVEWDESIRNHNESGGIRYSLVTRNSFIGQPGIFDVQEMDYCFLLKTVPRMDIERVFGVRIREAGDVGRDAWVTDADNEEDVCDVITCWYKNEDGEVCRYIFSGDTELSDIEDYYARKYKVCTKCGRKEGLCRCADKSWQIESAEYEEIGHDIFLSDGGILASMVPKIKNGRQVTKKIPAAGMTKEGTPAYRQVGGITLPVIENTEIPVLEKTRIPWYKPKNYPIVIRRNVSREEDLFGQSDIEVIRNIQDEINRLMSRIYEKAVNSASYPYKPEESPFRYDNTIGQMVLNLKPGESPSMYGVITTAVPYTEDLNLVQVLYDSAKRILGISDSYQGQYDASAQSGKAKQIQAQQSAGRLQSKRVLKNAAYADMDRSAFEFMLAYADEPRPIVYRDAFGRLQNETFHRYDFVDRDKETGEFYYNDGYTFSVDPNQDVESDRSFMWQLNQSNLQSGTYGNPADPAVLLRYWQAQEKAHYPGAGENVEYFRSMVERAEAQSSAVSSLPTMPAVK